MNGLLQELVHYLKENSFITSKEIETAFLSIDRALFIPKGWERYSYGDLALPIVDDVTISAPSVIARTFELAQLKPGNIVLEIGTGSGYSTALTSYIVGADGKIISVEVNANAYEYAKERLGKVGHQGNIELHNADGKTAFFGEHMFDAIIIHAAFPKIEDNWLRQLKPEGVIVGPLMVEEGLGEYLILYKKGQITYDIPVLYVPMH